MSRLNRIAQAVALLLLLCVISSAQIVGDDPQPIDITPTPDSENLIINLSILSYGSAKDLYNGRSAARSLFVQVDVENSDERPLWIKGLTFGFDPTQCDAAQSFFQQFNIARCREMYERLIRYPSAIAPTDQQQLLGVAAVGASSSKRAVFFRVLDFALTGLLAIAPYMNTTQAASTANLTGIGIPALQKLFPDRSGQQLQWLSSQTYKQGLIVGPKQSESFVIAIPTDRVFDEATWKLYAAPADRQSSEALEVKQFLQMVASVQIRRVYISIESAPDALSGNAMRRR